MHMIRLMFIGFGIILFIFSSCFCQKAEHSKKDTVFDSVKILSAALANELPKNREIRVQAAWYDGAWSIEVYVDRLLPEEVEGLHEMISKILSIDDVNILYLSNVLKVGDQIIKKDKNVYEFVDVRLLKRKGG